ncbi:MAG TPA: hypothetical protein VGR70_00205 [Stellaceae bacterium]|nr:hypothetical protein [Stellaceae bacterium]
MTYDTMTGWIEIADERRFVETAIAETAIAERPLPSERQHLHLGTAIFSLPCRIIDAVTHRHSDDAC